MAAGVGGMAAGAVEDTAAVAGRALSWAWASRLLMLTARAILITAV